MNNSPLVSTIVPLYNYEDYIEECVNSILAQDYSNLQVIVVDNGSIDRGGEIVSRIDDPRLELHRIEVNNGWAPALNLGYEFARGDWIHYFTADDVLRPNFYSRLVRETGKGYHLIGAWMQPVDENRKIDPEIAELHDHANFRDFSSSDYLEFAWQFPMMGNSFLCRADLMKSIMPVPNLIPGDWAIVIRALVENIKARIVEERLFDYRVHGTSFGARMQQLGYLVQFFYVHLTEFRPAAAKLNGNSAAELETFQKQFEINARSFIKDRPDVVARLIAASECGYDAAKRWPEIREFEQWVYRPDLEEDPAIEELRRIDSILTNIDDFSGNVDDLVEKYRTQKELCQVQKERLDRLRSELDQTKAKYGAVKEKLSDLNQTKSKQRGGFFRRRK